MWKEVKIELVVWVVRITWVMRFLFKTKELLSNCLIISSMCSSTHSLCSESFSNSKDDSFHIHSHNVKSCASTMIKIFIVLDCLVVLF